MKMKKISVLGLMAILPLAACSTATKTVAVDTRPEITRLGTVDYELVDVNSARGRDALNARQGASVAENENTVETNRSTAATTDQGMGNRIGANVRGSDSGQFAGLRTLNFDFDSAALTAEARSILDANIQWLKGQRDIRMVIEGHADEQGSDAYNMALGHRRADTVRRYMVSKGIPATRVRTISLGESRPLYDGHTEAAYAQNRRANFVPNPQTNPANRQASK